MRKKKKEQRMSNSKGKSAVKRVKYRYPKGGKNGAGGKIFNIIQYKNILDRK